MSVPSRNVFLFMTSKVADRPFDSVVWRRPNIFFFFFFFLNKLQILPHSQASKHENLEVRQPGLRAQSASLNFEIPPLNSNTKEKRNCGTLKTAIAKLVDMYDSG